MIRSILEGALLKLAQRNQVKFNQAKSAPKDNWGNLNSSKIEAYAILLILLMR